MGKGRKPLILKKADLRRNTAALFDRLAKDTEARDRFIHDPTGQLSAKVIKHKLSDQVSSDANRVLFAMLANEKFREWLGDYPARQKKGKKVTQDQFNHDFCNAVLKFGDSDLLRAVVKQAGDFGLPAFSKVAQQLFTGPEQSAVSPAATPSTSDKSAKSSQNFNGIALGDTTLVDPALLRAVIGQLLVHAQELQATGKLSDMNATIR